MLLHKTIVSCKRNAVSSCMLQKKFPPGRNTSSLQNNYNAVAGQPSLSVYRQYTNIFIF